MLGTKNRVALFDEQRERIRDLDNEMVAEMVAEVELAREKLSWAKEVSGSPGGEWIVPRVCSECLQYCERGFANGTISFGRRDKSSAWLNHLYPREGTIWKDSGREWWPALRPKSRHS